MLHYTLVPLYQIFTDMQKEAASERRQWNFKCDSLFKLIMKFEGLLFVKFGQFLYQVEHVMCKYSTSFSIQNNPFLLFNLINLKIERLIKYDLSKG